MSRILFIQIEGLRWVVAYGLPSIHVICKSYTKKEAVRQCHSRWRWLLETMAQDPIWHLPPQATK